MNPPINTDWQPVIDPVWHSELGQSLQAKLKNAYKNHTCYPAIDKIWQAFTLCPRAQVKVVIIGQDPYHQPNQAQGLAFSVPEKETIPPSLRNIYKEIKDDLNISPIASGDLSRWAKQGVLLLNNTLTVTAAKPASHRGWGWETLTDAVIQDINNAKQPVVFMLWGKAAAKKRSLIDAKRHLILEAAHPSPLSAYRGWFGCKHFSQANTFLRQHGRPPIDWT